MPPAADGTVGGIAVFGGVAAVPVWVRAPVEMDEPQPATARAIPIEKTRKLPKRLVMSVVTSFDRIRPPAVRFQCDRMSAGSKTGRRRPRLDRVPAPAAVATYPPLPWQRKSASKPPA